MKYANLVRYDEHFAVQLLVHEGRCQGVAALDFCTGEVFPVVAPAVILCTGGAGRIYAFTTNAAAKTGDGMALAYRAGVPLKDMELVQYHPTGLPDSGILITEAARGGMIPGQYGDYVHLDLRHLGAKRIQQRLPFIVDLCREYVGLDPVHDLIPVRPMVHYMMGGVHTDRDGATPLPGLYAAGECACVSLNGANRLGSNSLTELLVFGARAARAAVAFARQNAALATGALAAQAAKQQRQIRERFARQGSEPIVRLRQELNQALEVGAAIERDAEGLQQACTKVAELKARLPDLRLTDHSATFNTELPAALELENMIDVAECVVHSALPRIESRGAHQRRDFPKRDDQRFLKHSLAYRTDAAPRIEYCDVAITR